MKGKAGHRQHAKDGISAGLDAKRGILRYIDPDPDHVAALQ